jgi:hypothetical protein
VPEEAELERVRAAVMTSGPLMKAHGAEVKRLTPIECIWKAHQTECC